MRERPWFQSIGSGRAGDHITTLGPVREAKITNADGVLHHLRGDQAERPGEAKHVILIVLGVDHYLTLIIIIVVVVVVVVVDDDIDVFDESEDPAVLIAQNPRAGLDWATTSDRDRATPAPASSSSARTSTSGSSWRIASW